MAELLATMPLLPITSGMRVQFEAIDPTAGTPVAGVTISNAVLYATEPSQDEALPDPGPFMLVPGPESVA